MSGAEAPSPEPAPAGDRFRSPRRGMCAAVLTLEAVTLGLSTPVMIWVADVDSSVALPVGLGLAVAALLVAGLLRAEWGYGLGWAVQVCAIALGVLVTTMYFLGAVFGLLWACAYLLGRKIEREKAAAFAAYDAEAGAESG